MNFYPLLACLVEACHLHADTPVHPAVTHKIVNSPNPGSHPSAFPDGSSANLVLLGGPSPLSDSPEDWWPTGASNKIRAKLRQRFLREGHVLPILTALCMALLGEVYTTTWEEGQPGHRIRLQYRSSPIADFGIVSGIADVKTQDMFAYWDLVNDVFWKGQDPNKHYWLYFRTIRGEDIFLDCSMHTFNMCTMVSAQPYNTDVPLMPMQWAPALFMDREMSRTGLSIQTEHKRLSFLRNAKICEVLATDNFEGIHEIVEEFSGDHFTDIERNLLWEYTSVDVTGLSIAFQSGAWKRWPKDPQIGLDLDPGEEEDRTSPKDDEDWLRHLKKWNQKYRRGEISRDVFKDAYGAWMKKNAQQRK